MLATAQQESDKATEEHLALKSKFENLQVEVESHKKDLASVRDTSTADYKDLHDSMTQLLEEANKKTEALERQLREMEAQISVKDAEIKEANTKINGLKSPKAANGEKKGLSASIYADPEPEDETEEAEGEQDNLSASLAAVSRPSLLEPMCANSRES